MSRDKTQTRKKILNAVGQLLIRLGSAGIGINAIAHQAGVDKVLIYRYFGGLRQLLQAYSKEVEPWPTIPESLRDHGNIRWAINSREQLAELITYQLNEIRRRKLTQEILRAELGEKNVLTETLDDSRNRQFGDIMSRLKFGANNAEQADWEALMAFINAGVTYLILRSRTGENHLGIDLHSNFGWHRVEKIITQITANFGSKAD